MIHIPVSENRIAQFAAKFEPYDDAYVYYGDCHLGGLPVSTDERDYYVHNFARLLRTANWVMYGWVVLAAIGLVVAEEGFGWQVDGWQRALVFTLPLPWGIWMSWRSKHIVLEDIGRRMPVTRPRGYKAGVTSRVAAFPMAVPLMMIGIGTLLLIQQWRYGLVLYDFSGDVLCAGVIAFGLWIIWVQR